MGKPVRVAALFMDGLPRCPAGPASALHAIRLPPGPKLGTSPSPPPTSPQPAT